MGCRSPAVGTGGAGSNRYDADFGGADDTTLTEWSRSSRYFPFKEDDDSTPVSFAAHAALFLDDYGGEDEGLGTRLPLVSLQETQDVGRFFERTRSSGFHRRQSLFVWRWGRRARPSTSHANWGHGQTACGSKRVAARDRRGTQLST